MNKYIDEDFMIDTDIIVTEHGTFTRHDELGMSAQEYYEWWLKQIENPTPPKPTLEEVVKEQENKISILEEENELLKLELSITQDAVNELLFNTLNA